VNSTRACTHTSAKHKEKQAMPTGRVKFFDQEKGIGVIKPDEPGPDAYVSQFALEAARILGIKPKQRVFYQLEPDPITGRPVAGSLCLIDRRSKRRKVPS
jgi:CspA family cold shock protein